jgi:hypothetical protein
MKTKYTGLMAQITSKATNQQMLIFKTSGISFASISATKIPIPWTSFMSNMVNLLTRSLKNRIMETIVSTSSGYILNNKSLYSIFAEQ